MEIRFTHRNAPLTNAMKAYIQEKFAKFEKRIDFTEPFDFIYTAQVQNKGEATDHKIELMCKAYGNFIKVQKEGSDFYALVDTVERVLKTELNKAKSKKS